jgi:hypothetical protein
MRLKDPQIGEVWIRDAEVNGRRKMYLITGMSEKGRYTEVVPLNHKGRSGKFSTHLFVGRYSLLDSETAKEAK